MQKSLQIKSKTRGAVAFRIQDAFEALNVTVHFQTSIARKKTQFQLKCLFRSKFNFSHTKYAEEIAILDKPIVMNIWDNQNRPFSILSNSGKVSSPFIFR